VRAIRPQPHRGDVVAAGVVVLATLVLVLEARFGDRWAAGVQLAVSGLAAALVTAMALLSPQEAATPRPYQSVLYVTSLGLLLAALADLAAVLGGALASAGTLAWVGAALAAPAVLYASARGSATATLIASVAGGVALLAFVAWAWHPEGFAAFRWVLLVLMAGFGFGALSQRDRRRRHAVALTNAAALAALALAVTLQLDTGIAGALFSQGGAATAGRVAGPGWGWQLLLFAVSFGLIAYAAVDREPGPGYLGVAVLLLTILVAGEGGTSFVGWPLALALVALGLLAVGLRPSTPLPPEPGGSAPAEPLDFTHRNHPEDRS
jgi:hypothetical protein